MTHTRFRQLMKNKMAESLDFIGGGCRFCMVKMKKYINDIRKTCKSEVQIWKQTFLVSWILCRYGMEKCKKIQEYIANQLQDDLEYDQMTLKEYIDPFTGEPVKRNK